jgi:CheY-like chemotaxis protein
MLSEQICVIIKQSMMIWPGCECSCRNNQNPIYSRHKPKYTVEQLSNDNRFEPSLSCPGRALIIDDDEIQALLSKILLERIGYEVVTCNKPAEALTILQDKDQCFQFVACDYSMVPIDGLELSRSILRTAPSTVIFLITGYDHPELLREAREIGIREVCLKPTTVDEFADILIHAGL